jgi:HEAT repeat protein
VIQQAAAGELISSGQIAHRKVALRRDLLAAAAGESQTLAIDPDESGLDIAALIREVTAELQPGSPDLARMVAAFELTGSSDKLIDRLSASDVAQQASSARIVGALRMERAVPWLAPLLQVRDRAVREAAARALGRIGGARSAEALMRAIQRWGLSSTLIVELTRAAPDLFLESVLTQAGPSGATCAAALACGLRRRRQATTPLVALVASGSRRERVISCRALGWIGDRSAIPAVTAALEDSEPNVRASAQKALIALLAREPDRAVISQRRLDRL